MSTPPKATSSDRASETSLPDFRSYDAPDLEGLRRDLAAAAAESGLALGEASRWDLRDLFCDTDDDRFLRAGVALRIRHWGDMGEVAILGLTPALTGAFGEPGLSALILEARPTALRAMSGPVGAGARAVAGGEEILSRYEVRTSREVIPLLRGETVLARVRLEELAVADGRRGAPEMLRRLVLETASPRTKRLRRFLAALGAVHQLTRTRLPVPVAARRALGLETRPACELPGPDRVSPGMTVAEAAFAVLRGHARRCLEHEPGTRLGVDPEELHDMRVAVRRMRAALRLYAGALPQGAEALREELGWLGRGLGEVRDLDVQIARLRRWQESLPSRDAEALGLLIDLQKERRHGARARMLERLDSSRYDRCTEGLLAWLRRGPGDAPPAGQAPVLQGAPVLIASRRERVLKPGRRLTSDSPAEAYHRLRIRTKAFRYALEFHRDLYGPPAERMIRTLTDLQDLLGDHQDAHVAMAQLEGLARTEGTRLAPRTLLIMGRLAERYRVEALDLKARFPEKFAKLEGKRWHRLAKAFGDSRPAS